MKVAPQMGVCSAVWTFHWSDVDTAEHPVPPSGYHNHEIDFEFPGRPAGPREDISFEHGLLNTWIGEDDGSLAEMVTGYTDLGQAQDDGEWHTYTFKWHTCDPTATDQFSSGADNPRRVEFYVDGALVRTTVGPSIPTRAGTLNVGAWFPAEWAGDPAFETATLLVDTVKFTPYGETGDLYVDAEGTVAKVPSNLPPVEDCTEDTCSTVNTAQRGRRRTMAP
jgi:hypothetical protein